MKEGSQIGGCYCETVEQEGGEIFMISNRIRFFPLYCETVEQKFKPSVCA